MIKLIISADDFGMSQSFNKGILELLIAGSISSTSVMVNRNDDINDFNKLQRLSKIKKYSIGLHLEFTSKLYASSIMQQLNKFISIFNCLPSHIDIHKGLKFIDAFPFVYKLIKTNNMPLRNHGIIINQQIRQTSSPFFYATSKSIEEIATWIYNLKNDSINEIVFHPGYYDVNSVSNLNKERKIDYNNIIQLFEIVLNQGIKIINYNQLT